MLILSPPMFSSFSTKMFLRHKIDKRVYLRINAKDNTTAIPTVSTVWATMRLVFLAQKSDATATAIASFHMQSNLIDKMHNVKSPLRGLRRESFSIRRDKSDPYPPSIRQVIL